MKRLRRILWNGLAAMSALLCVATCVLWVFWVKPYSYVRWRPKHEVPDHSYSLGAYSHTGGCQVVIAWNLSDSTAQSQIATWMNRPTIKLWHSSEAPGRHYLAVEFEYRLPAALLAILPLLWIVLRFRAYRIRKQAIGHCHFCGYDLRATPDRCPECGTPVARK